MKVNAFNVNVYSENPERLIAFYADVIGLPRVPQSKDASISLDH